MSVDHSLGGHMRTKATLMGAQLIYTTFLHTKLPSSSSSRWNGATFQSIMSPSGSIQSKPC